MFEVKTKEPRIRFFLPKPDPHPCLSRYYFNCECGCCKSNWGLYPSLPVSAVPLPGTQPEQVFIRVARWSFFLQNQRFQPKNIRFSAYAISIKKNPKCDCKKLQIYNSSYKRSQEWPCFISSTATPPVPAP